MMVIDRDLTILFAAHAFTNMKWQGRGVESRLLEYSIHVDHRQERNLIAQGSISTLRYRSGDYFRCIGDTGLKGSVPVDQKTVACYNSCMKKRYIPILVLVLVFTLAACDDDPSGPEGTVPLTLSVAVGSSVPITLASASDPLIARSTTYEDGTNTLVVDYAALVLSEIELEGALDECPVGLDDDDDFDDDDCEEFETGPILLELPLDGSVDRVLEVFVAPGTYDELEFELDTPDDDDEREREFLERYPEFENVSVRVEGTWNGEPFVFVQDVEAEQETDLAEPLVVAEGSETRNLTLRLDISSWFVDGSGSLIDPSSALADGPNEELVEDNIEDSFEAFEDDDEDGEDDNDELDDD